MADTLGVQDRVALAAMRVVNAASRRARRGAGTVAGGRVAIRVSSGLLGSLARGTRVALVTGTNGKTTTTACLVAALRTRGAVATNATGSNMPPGHVAALAAAPDADVAVLECDEVWLSQVLDVERPEVIVLLNLSRDQLDRTAEVRKIAEAWRSTLGRLDGVCVANADDPLVVHAAQGAPVVAWFAGGLVWEHDAVACPNCSRGVVYDDAGWHCECGFARPVPSATVRGDVATVDGVEVALPLALPGEFNRANALGALLAAVRMGIGPAAGAAAIAAVRDVAGRFSTITVGAVEARLLLAKNPAGWHALLELVADDTSPVVVAVNARVADGHDPSWLYDVDFERLRGRVVVATGDRWRDLSTRLFYAGVDHRCEQDPTAAIELASRGADLVEVVANYTAFAELAGPR